MRAIAVLQRDLQREERRQEAIRLEAEAQKKSDEALQETQPVEDFQFVEPAPPSATEFIPTNPRNSPTYPGGPMNARRPSAISISSLQRPSLPPKLDLSSSSMRMSSDEGSGMYPSGLASPVTLAPKSARPVGPNEFPEDLLNVFETPVDRPVFETPVDGPVFETSVDRPVFESPVDRPVIDLTLTGNDGQHQIKTRIDTTAGDSSDKPIELDLDMDMDMNDLFGDDPETSNRNGFSAGVDNMFAMTGTGGPGNKSSKATDFMDLNPHDIFATLSNNSMNPAPDLRNVDSSTTAGAPSPATLLATGFPQHLNTSHPGTDHPFDMTSLGDLGDLTEFDSTSGFSLSDMDAFLNMGSGSTGGGVAGGSNADTKGGNPAEQPSAS